MKTSRFAFASFFALVTLLGIAVSHADPIDEFVKVEVEKAANLDIISAGDVVTYTFTIWNLGDPSSLQEADFLDTGLQDADLGLASLLGPLAKGERLDYTVDVLFDQALVDALFAGSNTYTNTASFLAVGDFGTGTVVKTASHTLRLASVPEPTTLALVVLGFAGAGWSGRRRTS